MKVYAKAIICKKWELPFYIPLVKENHLPKTRRSYLHYAAAHQDMVEAKCTATEWLYSGLKGIKSAREYYGGVGITATIIRGLYNLDRHVVGERDEACVRQLAALLEPRGGEVVREDSAKALRIAEKYDFKVLDFPHSTITQISGKLYDEFLTAFSTNPKAVAWTDTAATFFHVHKKLYGRLLSRQVVTLDDYCRAYSYWLFKNTGYTIKKAAHRGRNATYFLAVPGKTELEIKAFDITEKLVDFKFMGEDK